MTDHKFIYDAVPYPSFVFPQTHPDRLATLASIHGLDAADPSDCKMLELGCGDGMNLIAQAYALPQSSFVGIDLSQVHIDDGNRMIADLGLKNIELKQADVSSINSQNVGKFDFIVAHGLYSWVPDSVREQILRIYNECLAEKGVGYISYNALPGCRLRQIASEIMQYHARLTDDSTEKVTAGIGMLSFIAASAEEDSLYQHMLRLELENIQERTPSNVFHDDLAELNRPFYFHEFVRDIESKGMQYLCESDPIAISEAKLTPETRANLDKISASFTDREQLKDLIVAKRFRSSLIVRDSCPIDRNFDPKTLDRFLVGSQMEPKNEDLSVSDTSECIFQLEGQKGATVNHPLTKAALMRLRYGWSRSVPFAEMLEQAVSDVPPEFAGDDDIDILRSYLMQMYFAGLVKLRLHQPSFITNISEHPTASPVARMQIARGSTSVTTLNGINLDTEGRTTSHLITLLDGSRGIPQLISEIREVLHNNVADREFDIDEITAIVDRDLDILATSGLLVA